MRCFESEEFKQYRAPKSNATSLVDPSLDDLLGCLGVLALSALGEDQVCSCVRERAIAFAATGGGNEKSRHEDAAVRPEDSKSSSTQPQNSSPEFCGQPLALLRDRARVEVVGLALRYTRQYRDVATNSVSGVGHHPPALGDYTSAGSGVEVLDSEAQQLSRLPIVMAGHQPDLFHPGVWFKNFLLSKLQASGHATAINFVVDNDLCRSVSIRVPSVDNDGSVVAAAVPFDDQGAIQPWEQRGLLSRETWASFPQRVLTQAGGCLSNPLLGELWKDASNALDRSGRIGWALAESRHRLEGHLGLNTLEVPLSQLVSTRSFAQFSLQLLSEMPRFQAVYNSQLERYRIAHQIRNHAHPVPELEQEDGWLETPWWVYQSVSAQRERLWVKEQSGELILSDRASWEATFDARLESGSAVERWMQVLESGVCLRPRALLTTMYFRLIVCDQFVHGIGGGKYDQLTNAIVKEFFGIDPSPMAVATATLHLPLQTRAVAAAGSVRQTEELLRMERRRLWQARYHAEDVLGDDPSGEAARLIQRKHALLANVPPRGEKWEWHREITKVNKRLSELASEQASKSREQIAELSKVEKQQNILESREFSFALFEADFIGSQLKRLAAAD